MIIKERKYRTCKRCGSRKMVKDEEYGCDNCKKPIDLTDRSTYLSVDLFQQQGETSHVHLCSWECVLGFILYAESDYFITLPYIHCDRTHPDREDFFAAIKKMGKSLK